MLVLVITSLQHNPSQLVARCVVVVQLMFIGPLGEEPKAFSRLHLTKRPGPTEGHSTIQMARFFSTLIQFVLPLND